MALPTLPDGSGVQCIAVCLKEETRGWDYGDADRADFHGSARIKGVVFF